MLCPNYGNLELLFYVRVLIGLVEELALSFFVVGAEWSFRGMYGAFPGSLMSESLDGGLSLEEGVRAAQSSLFKHSSISPWPEVLCLPFSRSTSISSYKISSLIGC